VEEAFSRKVPLASLLDAPTIEQQARILQQEDWVPSWSSLVPLRISGELPPLYLAAPVGGNVLSYRDLTRYLPSDRPIYGLQSLGLDGIQRPLRSIEEVAAHYIREIRTVQPHGPYYLGGSSFGGLVSYEMAQQLHDQGERVALVLMIDTYGPNYPRRKKAGSRWRRKMFKYLRRVDTHWSNLVYSSWPGRLLYLRTRGKRLALKLGGRLKLHFQAIMQPTPVELRRIQRVNATAAARGRKRYSREPRRFGGRLVLFRAEKQPLGIYFDPTLGWEAVTGAGLEVYEVPGHHTSLIYEPRVSVLARRLNQILFET
jgi:aspartate racemase